jgi:hypothetical protein
MADCPNPFLLINLRTDILERLVEICDSKKNDKHHKEMKQTRYIRTRVCLQQAQRIANNDHKRRREENAQIHAQIT